MKPWYVWLHAVDWYLFRFKKSREVCSSTTPSPKLNKAHIRTHIQNWVYLRYRHMYWDMSVLFNLCPSQVPYGLPPSITASAGRPCDHPLRRPTVRSLPPANLVTSVAAGQSFPLCWTVQRPGRTSRRTTWARKRRKASTPLCFGRTKTWMLTYNDLATSIITHY
jgi:hypothetical protein